MPIRWVICPVVVNRDKRMPKVGTIHDPGLPAHEAPNGTWVVPKYCRSNVISTQNWCICFVRGVDMSNLDADPQVISILEQDQEDGDGFLAKTPNDLGWSNAKLKRVKKRMEDKGADFTGLNKNDPLWKFLKRLGQVLHWNFPGPYGTWVK